MQSVTKQLQWVTWCGFIGKVVRIIVLHGGRQRQRVFYRRAHAHSFFSKSCRHSGNTTHKQTLLHARTAYIIKARAPVKRGDSPRRVRSGFGVRDFQTLLGDLLDIYDKIATKILCVFQVEIFEPNCGKMPYLAMLKNPFKNSWIRIQRRMAYNI